MQSSVARKTQYSRPGPLRAALFLIIVTLLATAGLALAGPPSRFVLRGPGGGGGFFGASVNPFCPRQPSVRNAAGHGRAGAGGAAVALCFTRSGRRGRFLRAVDQSLQPGRRMDRFGYE